MDADKENVKEFTRKGEIELQQANKALLMKKERQEPRMKQTQMVSARESSYLWYVKGMDVHKST